MKGWVSFEAEKNCKKLDDFELVEENMKSEK